jgi:hypothetical protein
VAVAPAAVVVLLVAATVAFLLVAATIAYKKNLNLNKFYFIFGFL